MKKSILIFCTLSYLLICTIPTNAQWVQTNGPCGGSVSLAINGSDIFAGSGTGFMFFSSDDGANWGNKSNGLPNGLNYGVAAPVFMGVKIFTTVESNLFLSTNNGSNWISVANDLPYGTISSLVVDGSNILGVNSGNVFLSTNGGSNWTDLMQQVFKPHVRSLFVNNSKIYAGTDNGLLISTDNGNNWKRSSTGFPTNTLVNSLIFNGENIFAGTVYRGVYLSTDSGNNWVVINNGFPINYGLPTINSFAVNGTTIFAGTDKGIFLSNDTGGNWISVNNNLPSSNIGQIIINNTSVFAAVGYDGVFVSVNNGSSWTPVNNGLINTEFVCVGTSGTNVFAGTYGNGMFLSNDKGNNWTVTNYDASFEVAVTSGSSIFAGSGGSILVSNDSGKNWNRGGAIPASSVYDNIQSLGINGSNIFVGTETDGVFLSIDSGTSWTAINNGLPVYNDINDPFTDLYPSIYSFAFINSNIFVGTSYGLFLSSNNGGSWTDINGGFPSSVTISALAVIGTSIFAGTSNGVFLSTDNGVNWTVANNGLPSSGTSSFAVYGTDIFTAIGEKIFFSKDNGGSWIDVSDGLPNFNIYSLAISSTDIYAGTDIGGVWRRPLSEVVGIEKYDQINGFSIYPNPATAQLAIRGSSFHNEVVTVSIMNMLGQAASPPAPLQRRGEEDVIDVSKLSSGIYFLQLKSESGSVVKKFVKE